jgi:porphobilinogen deaminase
VEPERRLVAAIGGGCLAPIAAHHDGNRLHALIAAEDGSWVERRSGDDPDALAAELVELAAARDKIGAQSAQPRA